MHTFGYSYLNIYSPQGKAFIFDEFELKHDGRYPKLMLKYQCEDCTICPVAKACKMSEGNRNISINPVLFELQDLSKANLDSPQGIDLWNLEIQLGKAEFHPSWQDKCG